MCSASKAWHLELSLLIDACNLHGSDVIVSNQGLFLHLHRSFVVPLCLRKPVYIVFQKLVHNRDVFASVFLLCVCLLQVDDNSSMLNYHPKIYLNCVLNCFFFSFHFLFAINFLKDSSTCDKPDCWMILCFLLGHVNLLALPQHQHTSFLCPDVP